MVSRSSAESEYSAMTNIICKMIWVKDLLTELDFAPECLVRLYYDTRLLFTKRKISEVDCNLVRQMIEEKIVQARHVSSDHQLAGLLTKSFKKT